MAKFSRATTIRFAGRMSFPIAAFLIGVMRD
jgi:hypothetical protein